MDHLWSPWRYQYVSSAGIVPLGKDFCFFCQIAANLAEDAVNLVVLRAERSFVLLNRYPYCSGHLMIAPYAHVAALAEAEAATLEEMMRLAQRCESALRQVYAPDGFNFGFNIGQAAGAGVAGHIHMHGLPRWSGDTSFMTTIGETRVLPEDLAAIREKLAAALADPNPDDLGPNVPGPGSR
jgi:ATP adenylyltransferase